MAGYSRYHFIRAFRAAYGRLRAIICPGGGLSVSAPGQPELEFILAAPEMGHDEETARQLRELLARGTGSA